MKVVNFMRDDKVRKIKESLYYDGHYPKLEMSLEEIEKILEEEKKKAKK